jgi:hypothetical protein
MTEAFPGTGSQEQDQHGWRQEIPKYSISHFYRVRKFLKDKTHFYRVRKILNTV